MLLDPGSLDLAAARRGGARAPRRRQALQARAAGLPAGDHASAGRIGHRGRARAARARATTWPRAVDGLARPAAAAVHPFAATEGELNTGERYERALRDYGIVARRQLVCALQVHVAVAARDRSLAVYNALRSHLPELAALAAAAPLLGGPGHRPGLGAPAVAGQLPRQGIPPRARRAGRSFADDLRWGAASGRDPGAPLVVVGASPPSGLRDARGAGSRSTGDGRRGGGRGGGGPRARRPPRRRPRRRPACRAGAEVAHRGEPLVGVPVGRRGRDGRPEDRTSAPPRASRLSALLDELEPYAAGARLRGGARAGARARGAQRRAAPARARRASEARAGSSQWLAERVLRR